MVPRQHKIFLLVLVLIAPSILAFRDGGGKASKYGERVGGNAAATTRTHLPDGGVRGNVRQFMLGDSGNGGDGGDGGDSGDGGDAAQALFSSGQDVSIRGNGRRLLMVGDGGDGHSGDSASDSGDGHAHFGVKNYLLVSPAKTGRSYLP